MNLIIDIGNTRIKAAVFNGGRIVERLTTEGPGTKELEALLDKYPSIENSILSSTRKVGHGDECDAEHEVECRAELEVEKLLKERAGRYVRFGSRIPTPLRNLYRTPDTLGPDRLAAAVGAHALYPNKNLLVADFGTALTIDFVTAAGEYAGGNISAGASMRLRALHDYTGRLPLMKMTQAQTVETLYGQSTAEAIEAGVVNGIVFELEGYIERFGNEFGEVMVIFTGGEAKFFENKLKNTIFAEYRMRFGNPAKTSFRRLPSPFTIFAEYDLVLIGLNTILEYNNADKK